MSTQNILNAALILASCAGLWWGAVWVVEASARIARRLGMSELVIGLTVVAFGTSAPEFAVTVNAALRGQSDISVGNVVGSNIFNLGFILGGVALFHPIRTSRQLVFRDGSVLVGTAALLLLLMLDSTLSRWEGGLLLVLLVVYLSVMFRAKKPIEEETPAGTMHWHDIPRLVAGIAVVVGAGHLLVENASALARAFGVSDWVIGVTIVAAGTSAPELATSLVAAARGRHGISIGNLIGSDLFNLMGVLGFAGIIRPMQVSSDSFGSLVMLFGLVVLVVAMLRTGWRLSRLEGGILVALNLVRWVMDFSGRGQI